MEDTKGRLKDYKYMGKDPEVRKYLIINAHRAK